MKRIVNVLTGLMLACTLTVMTTCSGPDKDEPEITPPGDETQTNPDDPENPPQYMYVDKDSELGESLGEWDAAILGVDGTSYWCKFSGDLPERLVIWDNSGETGTLQCSILFDDEGLPHKIIAGGYAFILANYSGKTFDMAIFYNDEYIGIERELATDMDWDAYRAGLWQPDTRAYDISRRDRVRTMLYFTSLVKCAVSVGLATISVGAGTLPAILNCGNFLLTLIDLVCDCIPPELQAVLGCVTLNKSCLEALGDKALLDGARAIDDYFDQRPQMEVDLTIEFTAEVSDINISIFSADAIVTVKTYPSWNKLSTVKNEFGIFYSTKPTLNVPDADRKKHNFVSSSGNTGTPERIPISELEPNTTYYYCTYIVYNGTIGYGEIKNFKTKSPSLTLSSPEQGTEVKPGKSVDIIFHCSDPNTDNQPLTGITVYFESSDGQVNYSSRQTDESGDVTVSWTPDKSSASLTAKILDSKGNVVTECSFTTKFDLSGVWVYKNASTNWGIGEDGSEVFLGYSNEINTFYPDGRYVFEVETLIFGGVVVGLIMAGSYQFNDSYISTNACVIWTHPDLTSPVVGDCFNRTEQITVISNSEYICRGGIHCVKLSSFSSTQNVLKQQEIPLPDVQPGTRFGVRYIYGKGWQTDHQP
jgi:hypothetical protein